MLQINDETAEDLLRELRTFGERIGAPPGSLARLEQGIQTLAGGGGPLPAGPYQRPNFLIPGLTAKPIWDPGDFGWTARLEASSDVIKRELLRLRGQRFFGMEPEVDLIETG